MFLYEILFDNCELLLGMALLLVPPLLLEAGSTCGFIEFMEFAG